MPSDYYDSEDDGSTEVAVSENPEGDTEVTSEEDSNTPVEVVSKDFFIGMTPKVGGTHKIRVTQVNEDSCLIKMEKHDEESSDEMEMPEDESEMMGEGTPKRNFYE